MPDHIHFCLFARETLPRALGRYIGMMKVKCAQIIRAEFPETKEIFTQDFHDRYLRPVHSLKAIINYIQQNPYRLLVRQLNPYWFRKINNLEIQGMQWQAYGNLQLLENPFKTSVIIHRSDSPDVLVDKRSNWKYLAENGGVLVSAFISPAEKEIRRQCEAVNGKLILLSNKPFGEKEKPSAHDFDICATGRLLILSPMQSREPSRETFLFLNSIAEAICLT